MPTENTGRLLAIREQIEENKTRMSALLELADAEDRDMTADEETDWQELEANIETLKKREAREEKFLSLKASNPEPIVQTSQASNPQFSNQREAFEDDPKCGYATHREFLLDVMDTTQGNKQPSAQLQFLAAAGSDEHNTKDDSRGGFLLPEGMAPGVLSTSFDADPTASRVTSVPMQTQTVKFNARVDKNHTSSVSGGLQVYRGEETQAASASRTQMEQVKLEAEKLQGLAYASEELLERSPISFTSILEAGFNDEFASKMFDEKLNGSGVGRPLGILNSPCLVTVAKEGGQTADTVNGTNIVKMRARAHNFERSIWLANHDTYVSLVSAHIAGTNGDVFIFHPGNGSDVPATLLGRPIFFTEYAKTLGDAGDIVLGDWSQYLWGTMGSQNPRRAESIHVRFTEHERTFKFWSYSDGQPWWKTALTPKNGANTLSPFVTLAERA